MFFLFFTWKISQRKDVDFVPIGFSLPAGQDTILIMQTTGIIVPLHFSHLFAGISAVDTVAVSELFVIPFKISDIFNLFIHTNLKNNFKK